MRAFVAVVVCVAGLGLAGCGGGSDEPETTTTVAPATTVPADDEARTKALLLKLDDLPQGWAGPTAMTEQATKGLRESMDKVARCAGATTPPADQVRSEFQSFQQQREVLFSAAQVYPDAATLKNHVTAMKSPKALDCMKNETVNSAKAELARLGMRDIEPSIEVTVVPGLALGDGSYALRTVAQTIFNGRGVQLVTEVIFATRDRYAAGASLSYFNAYPPADLEARVFDALQAKVSADLG